jgi:hypothetical protein
MLEANIENILTITTSIYSLSTMYIYIHIIYTYLNLFIYHIRVMVCNQGYRSLECCFFSAVITSYSTTTAGIIYSTEELE